MLDLEKNRVLAKKNKKEHKAFLTWMRKKKPKDLDVIVQQKHDEVFNQIDCLECANCCKTTGPLFTERDIARIAKKMRMRPAHFTDKYLRKDEDNDWVLQALPCPFLLEDNYCGIYDYRPKACAEYPHTDRRKIYQINPVMEKNIPICPAAQLFVNKLMVYYKR